MAEGELTNSKFKMQKSKLQVKNKKILSDYGI